MGRRADGLKRKVKVKVMEKTEGSDKERRSISKSEWKNLKAQKKYSFSDGVKSEPWQISTDIL